MLGPRMLTAVLSALAMHGALVHPCREKKEKRHKEKKDKKEKKEKKKKEKRHKEKKDKKVGVEG